MISNKDAIQFLQDLPSESIDLICTDIAYQSLEKHRAIGTTTRLTGEWFDIFPNERIPELFDEMYRVLANHSHLYFFCDSDTMFLTRPIGEKAGFKYWNEIVWDKVKIGMGYHYRRRKEYVLLFEKGKRKLNDLGVPDILPYERVDGGYPTEKPVPLLRKLITNSTVTGEIVCDPFCGSGSALEAAAMDGRRFIGNDLSAEAVSLSMVRLANHWDLAYAPPERVREAKQAVLF
jgi:site-specific DNA-methyltransferase (adenine-specific)